MDTYNIILIAEICGLCKVLRTTTECLLNLGNGRSPYGHINQRLLIQFKAPDDERYAARNMLSLEKTLE